MELPFIPKQQDVKGHSCLISPTEVLTRKSHNKQVPKKRRRSSVVEKFREVSDSVWVSFEAVIIEKTLKEE